MANPATKGKDLDAFRASHDRSFIIPKRIRDGLADLGDSWEYEGEFLKRCKISTHEFGTYRDQFKDFYVETPTGGSRDNGKRVWAGTKGFAAKLRAQIS
jgi:hypothetical protein